MKYLKLPKVFEDINNGYSLCESHGSEYEEITSVDLSNYRKYNDEVFDDGSRVYKILYNFGFRYRRGLKYLLGMDTTSRSLRNGRPNSNVRYLIYKCRDDWYYLCIVFAHGVNNVYFRCDQFDGLLNCLKKECGIS